MSILWGNLYTRKLKMSQFYKLTVSNISKQTEDTVTVSFLIPENLKSTFSYIPGQYLTLKFIINGKDERRSYSLCSSPFTNEEPTVAVKRVDKGIVSNYINDKLSVGDEVEVMAPEGNFILDVTKNPKSVVAFAAGSGITPIYSMIKSVIAKSPETSFTLFYGNRSKSSTIFGEEIHKIDSKFNCINVLSREESGNALTNGRIDKNKATELLKNNLELLKADAFYMCGPEEMIFNVKEALETFGVNADKVHYELFTTPTMFVEEGTKIESDFTGVAKVKVIYDDEEVEFDLDSNGENVLDAAAEHDLDVPFSCKGGVCCTCKALVTKGKMTMDANYSLSDKEVEEGYVLACQAHPASEYVVVDFDEA